MKHLGYPSFFAGDNGKTAPGVACATAWSKPTWRVTSAISVLRYEFLAGGVTRAAFVDAADLKSATNSKR
jgi:hypothetical protein